MRKLIVVAALGPVLAASATAGVGGAQRPVTADGSSTVGPYVIAAAEGFQKKNRGVQVTVGISGTGGGFERFCRGEIDLSNASRPMKQSGSDRSAARTASATSPSRSRTTAFRSSSTSANTWANCLTAPS